MTNRRFCISFALVSLAVFGVVSNGYAGASAEASFLLAQTPNSANKKIEASSGDKPRNGSPKGPDQRGDARKQSTQPSRNKMIDLVLFSVGFTGFFLGAWGLLKSTQMGKRHTVLQQRLQEYIKRANNDRNKDSGLLESTNDEIKNLSRRLSAIEGSVKHLSAYSNSLSSRLDHQESLQIRSPSAVGEEVSLNQAANLQRLNTDPNRVPGAPLNLYAESQLPSSSISFGGPPIKSAMQRQVELTAAVNRNDRPAIRNATRTQLNITSDSESAYAIGRLVQTELEEVSGGGSYLLLDSDGQYLLYPTDQTLRGFGQTQPAKGVFNYERQSIASPQVITPALVELVGIHWRVQQVGTIAIPG